MDAADAAAVIDSLQTSGYLPVSTRELGLSGGAQPLAFFSQRRISRRDIQNFTRELATMLSAGLPLTQALATLTSLSDKPATKDLFERIRGLVESGATLSAALQQSGNTFSRFYISLIHAGEASGALDQVLTRLAEYQSRSQQLRDAVIAALVYPAILMFVAGSSLVVLLIYVVPQFEPLFEDLGQALPFSTQIVIAMANVLRNFWWAFPIAAAAAYFLYQRIIAQPVHKRRWDRVMQRLPIIGELITHLEVTRLCRTLGTLTHSGVALLDGVNIVRESTANQIFYEAFDALAKDLEQGRGLSQPMAEAGCFPQLAVQLTRVGEETGGLAAMLLKLADIYDEQAQTSIKRLLSFLEPVLILSLGLFIAFIIVSILLAILGLNELVV